MTLDVMAVIPADLERDFFGRASRLADDLAGTPVLTRTLRRLRRVEGIGRIAIAAPAEQMDRIRDLAEGDDFVAVNYTRNLSPGWQAMRAARAFARHGWRGGLAGTCVFDELFDTILLPEIIDKTGAEALTLAHPGSVLLAVEWVAAAVDWLIENHRASRMVFDQAPPGLSAAGFEASFVRDLSKHQLFPGRNFVYNPRAINPDPISQPFNRVLPQELVATRARLLADTPRGHWLCEQVIERVGEDATGAEVCKAVQAMGVEPWPREVTVELTTRRPIEDRLRPAADRPDLTIDQLRDLLAGLDDVADVNVFLGGAGDALLHADWPAAVGEARTVGTVALGTYGLNLLDQSEALLKVQPEIVQVYVDAMTDQTYHAHKTGGSAKDAWRQIEEFLKLREQAKQTLPLVVPTMLKTHQALPEQDEFFDHSLLLAGWGVIAEPTTATGGSEFPGVVRMAPPIRRPCERIRQRLTARSDATVLACEEDLPGRWSLPGSLLQAWRSGELAELRSRHASGQWSDLPVCGDCQEFHRP